MGESTADIEFSQEQKNVGDSLGASRSVAEDANTEFSPLRKVRIKLLHDDSIKDDFGSDVWEATCLHEIGHSLGLRHSPYFDDCMYFVNKRKELSASDVASIKHLYAPLTIKAGKDVLQAESAKGNYYAQCKLGTLIISDHANYNEFADALSFWTKSARHGYYEAWDKLAWAHFYGVGVARNFQSAQAECSKAIACQPNYTPPYFNRAQLYCSLQNFKAAIQDCNAALRLEPRNPVAYNNRAAANEIANDYSSAISDYTEAIRLAPEFALSYRNRAQAYAQMFMFDNAIEDQTKAIALLLANQADAYCSLGKYFLLKKAVGEAQLNFKKAAATADSISGFAPRSEAKLRLGLYTEALSDANRAVRAEPWESNAYCRRGEALMALGKIKEALHDFDAALAIEIKNHGEAFYLRAQAYKALGDNKKAQVDEANANRCGYHALPPLIKLK
jgi:tetratricopeptide (TPR) repeat protein